MPLHDDRVAHHAEILAQVIREGTPEIIIAGQWRVLERAWTARREALDSGTEVPRITQEFLLRTAHFAEHMEADLIERGLLPGDEE